MEWAKKMAEYDAAVAENEHAKELRDNLAARLETCDGRERASVQAGLMLARRRVDRTLHQLAVATDVLTQGRPLIEVLWSAPDEI